MVRPFLVGLALVCALPSCSGPAAPLEPDKLGSISQAASQTNCAGTDCTLDTGRGHFCSHANPPCTDVTTSPLDKCCRCTSSTLGCGLDCQVCDLTHASGATCNSNGGLILAATACVPTCNNGYYNADGDGMNGCEATCTVPTHCGSDCLSCNLTHAGSASCTDNTSAADTSCVPNCQAGYRSTDGHGMNGCETTCNTSLLCGSDCLACDLTHASNANCTNNTSPADTSCKPVCKNGYANVNGLGMDGCEATCDQDALCGTDCQACLTNGQTASNHCANNTAPAASACTPNCAVIAGQGIANWDGNNANGCEACNSLTACGTDCLACGNQNAAPTCSGNTVSANLACVRNCTSGWTDTDNNPTNGCETQCTTAAHCGSDCKVCGVQNAAPTCNGAGQPAAVSCVRNCTAGWTDADGDPTNGCEAACTTIAHCGSDCRICGSQNTSVLPTCSGSGQPASTSCVISCAGGYLNVDGDPTNGCEASCNIASRCGSDCKVCGNQNAAPTCNGNGSPAATMCVRNCTSGWADADGDPVNGCEAACITTARCGTDCKVCSNVHAAPTCNGAGQPAATSCVRNCASGWADADGDPTTGCEAQCNVVGRCGSDCRVCGAQHATPSCTGNSLPATTSCVRNCASGWADVDGDPATGCEGQCSNTTRCGTDCRACGNQHAAPTCSGNGSPAATSCVRNCATSWADADGDPTNGCEAACTTTAYCGTDCRVCGSQNTSTAPTCAGSGVPAATACQISCAAGFRNVDNDPTNGCEASCNVVGRCGSDCLVCNNTHSSPSCNGNGSPAATACVRNCDNGWADVDGDPATGCEGQCNTTSRCGSDCLACGAQHTTAAPTCSGNSQPAATSCVFQCSAGYFNLNGDPADGCESTCNTTLHCGSDCKLCGSQHASPTCSGNVNPATQSCVLNCDAGWVNLDGDPSNGCEAPCDDIARCGSDCKACGNQHANPSCTGHTLPAASSCLRNCDNGWADGNGDPLDGCEAICDTAARCGRDCLVCGAQHGSQAPTCAGNTNPAASSCQFYCLQGFSNADNDPTNGCEKGCDTPAQCGSDCRPCGTQHANPVCTGNNDPATVTCQLNCNAGWFNADGDPTTGCEAECLTTTICGTDCRTCGSQHATPTCSGSTLPAVSSCHLQCSAGWRDGDGDPTSGCEAACDQNAHCGLECVICNTRNTSTVACTSNTVAASQACNPTCAPGYLNMDNDNSNGCETPCATIDHCGTSCEPCAAKPNATPSCVGPAADPTSACKYACNPGYAHVDLYAEGCELACTTTDHCGSDCAACPATLFHGTSTCKGNDVLATSACGVACETGYADTDGKASTGCEDCAVAYYNASATGPKNCQACDVSDHCGMSGANLCVDCTKGEDGVRCLAGRCACNNKDDCPGTTCRHHSCVTVCTTKASCPDPVNQLCCGPTDEMACVTKGPEVCDGKDNDCNGVIDDNVQVDDAPLCDNQLGVCKGSHWTCNDGLFTACTDAVYKAYSPDYEPVETRCDGKDNDCNGLTDEPAKCQVDAGRPDASHGGGETYTLGGCGCSQAAAPAGVAALLFLAALVSRRRRR